MRPIFQGLLVLILLIGSTTAAAKLPKDRAEAPEVITGTVLEVSARADRYDDGRVVTKHTATIKVHAVERTTPDKGRTVKAGDTITVYWSRVEWARGTPRAIGHIYDVRQFAAVRAYLHRQCGGEGFFVIDNAQALLMPDPAKK
jgi:hypothetical protein